MVDANAVIRNSEEEAVAGNLFSSEKVSAIFGAFNIVSGGTRAREDRFDEKIQ
jgi:hypothetical protein